MALSGSVDFTLTAREIIDYALRKISVLGSQRTADADMAEDARLELNLMLKGFQKWEWLWKLEETSVTLVPNQITYTLDPPPHRIISARYDDQDIEIPMILMSREEYFDLPVKDTQGIPTQYYVDYQRDNPILYVWPVINSVTDETINITQLTKLDDIDDLSNNVDVKRMYLELVGYQLAARLLDDYGIGGEVANRIIARAERMLQEAQDEEREPEIRFIRDDTRASAA
jgi:hypothetical protein